MVSTSKPTMQTTAQCIFSNSNRGHFLTIVTVVDQALLIVVERAHRSVVRRMQFRGLCLEERLAPNFWKGLITLCRRWGIFIRPHNQAGWGSWHTRTSR